MSDGLSLKKAYVRILAGCRGEIKSQAEGDGIAESRFWP